MLVLDDDVAICRIVSQMLSAGAYDVRTTQTIDAALAAIKEKPFDIYILDHRLPNGSGLEVAERLRAIGSTAPILLLSGYDLGEAKARAEAAFVYEIVQKPFSANALQDALRRGLRAPPVVLPTVTEDSEQKKAEPFKAKKGVSLTVRIAIVFLFLIIIGVAIYMWVGLH